MARAGCAFCLCFFMLFLYSYIISALTGNVIPGIIPGASTSGLLPIMQPRTFDYYLQRKFTGDAANAADSQSTGLVTTSVVVVEPKAADDSVIEGVVIDVTSVSVESSVSVVSYNGRDVYAEALAFLPKTTRGSDLIVSESVEYCNKFLLENTTRAVIKAPRFQTSADSLYTNETGLFFDYGNDNTLDPTRGYLSTKDFLAAMEKLQSEYATERASRELPGGMLRSFYDEESSTWFGGYNVADPHNFMDTVGIVEWFNRSLIDLDTHFIGFATVLSRCESAGVSTLNVVLDFTGGTHGWVYKVFQPSITPIVGGPENQISNGFLLDILDSFWFTAADAISKLSRLNAGSGSTVGLPNIDGQHTESARAASSVSELVGYLLDKGLSSCCRQGRLDFMLANGDINLSGNLITSDSYADYAWADELLHWCGFESIDWYDIFIVDPEMESFLQSIQSSSVSGTSAAIDMSSLRDRELAYLSQAGTSRLFTPKPFVASPLNNVLGLPWFLDYVHLSNAFFFMAMFVLIMWVIITATLVSRNIELRQPVRETRGFSRAQTGDGVTAVLPLTWSISMLMHASTHAVNFDENTSGTTFTLTVIAYQ